MRQLRRARKSQASNGGSGDGFSWARALFRRRRRRRLGRGLGRFHGRVRGMAFRASLIGEMIGEIDLGELRRARNLARVAAQTELGVRGLRRRFRGILRMHSAGAVAGFTGKPAMAPLGDLRCGVFVAFRARSPAGISDRVRGDLLQRISAVPAVLAKGGGHQEPARDEIHRDDRESQENQACDLGRHERVGAGSPARRRAFSSAAVAGETRGASRRAAYFFRERT